MLIKLIKIGNSQGIRLPKNVINECGFQSEINLTIDKKRVILTAKHQERWGWRERIQLNDIQSMHQSWEREWKW